MISPTTNTELMVTVLPLTEKVPGAPAIVTFSFTRNWLLTITATGSATVPNKLNVVVDVGP